MSVGPVQLLVIGVPAGRSFFDLLPEVRTLRETGYVRVIDLVTVRKDARGTVTTVEMGDAGEQELQQFAAEAGRLIGFGASGKTGAAAGAAEAVEALSRADYGLTPAELQEIVARIPAGGTTIFALLEHTWLASLRDTLHAQQGKLYAHAVLSPETLLAFGRTLRQASKGTGEDAGAAR